MQCAPEDNEGNVEFSYQYRLFQVKVNFVKKRTGWVAEIRFAVTANVAIDSTVLPM
jgi:hypothetical protein